MVSQQSLVDKALDILDRLEQLKSRNIFGINKFETHVRSELSFLQQLQQLKPAHLACSNLPHLDAILQVVENEQGVTHVYKVFHFKGGSVKVDVVSHQGLRWIKVKASDLVYSEPVDSSDEDEAPTLHIPPPSLIKQAINLVKAAEHHPVHFQTPQVIVKLMHVQRIDPYMVNWLHRIGALVEDEVSPSMAPESLCLQAKLNLDVNTLIAMVSDITHRFHDIPWNVFNNVHLQQQGRHEQEDPMLPRLLQVFKGKTLVTTQEAWTKFKSIVDEIGGPTECMRAHQLLDPPADMPFHVQLVPDHPCPDFEAFIQEKRKNSGCRLKPQHVKIFGTGQWLSATTITANSWIESLLLDMGQSFSIWVHQPRSLIEKRWLSVSQEH